MVRKLQNNKISWLMSSTVVTQMIFGTQFCRRVGPVVTVSLGFDFLIWKRSTNIILLFVTSFTVVQESLKVLRWQIQSWDTPKVCTSDRKVLIGLSWWLSFVRGPAPTILLVPFPGHICTWSLRASSFWYRASLISWSLPVLCPWMYFSSTSVRSSRWLQFEQRKSVC